MAVMARGVWTDERLDDLNHRVDEGFNEMRQELRAARVEIGRESQAVRTDVREELRAVRAEMKEELRGIRGEIGALNRSVIQLAYAMVGTVFLGFMGTIAALVTLGSDDEAAVFLHHDAVDFELATEAKVADEVGVDG